MPPIPQGGKYDLRIYQGATFAIEFQIVESDEVTPVPLTGYTAKGQVRSAEDSGQPLVLDFTTEVVAATGIVRLRLEAAETALLTADGFYDVFLTSATDTLLFLQGSVTVDRRVTVV